MTPRLLSRTERRDWLRLSMSENVGPQTFRALMKRYGSAAAAIEAIPDLAAKGGLSRSPRLYGLDAAERDMARADAMGARFIAQIEPDFPALLRSVDTAPPLLCVKGEAALLSKSPIAIVGARNASAIARKFARQLAQDLGAAGHAVVSGLARGIDTAAHEAALKHGTVAVVAGGIDIYYPPENEALQRDIADQGALVSEMVPGTPPTEKHFPRRNRIISGLSRALIVVEAALRSGSLITARFAAEQGREVFAVPGSPLDPRCEGANKLIRDGATLLSSARDVVEALAAERPQRQLRFEEDDAPPLGDPADLDGDARALLLELLSPTPIEVDDLIRESGLAPAAVSALLLELSVAGRIAHLPDGSVSLA